MRLPWSKDASSVTTTPERKYPNSLLKRFRKAIIWLYVASVLVSIPVIYATTYYQARAVADKELSLLVDMVASVRKYISEDVRADLMKANLFQSPAISSTVTTAHVAKNFRELQPDYYIKVASDNPLNPKNKPEPLEWTVLERFRADAKLDQIVEVGSIKGKQYLVSARPSHAKQGCLVCHGSPSGAPEPIRAAYGTTDGYHYKVGSVVGTIVVGVPMGDINALVLDRTLVALGIFTLIFAVIFLTVSSIVRRQIVQPVAKITDIATAISRGELGQTIPVQQEGSEIAELAHAIQLVQRSLAFAMKKGR
jgi:methyl-accepting chemotaxis protein